MWVVERPYLTPRRLIAPSTVLVEARAHELAPSNGGGEGGDNPSFPWCLCFHV